MVKIDSSLIIASYSLFGTDFSKFPLFEIVFLDYMIAAWSVIFITTATDTLFFSIGLNLIIQLKILQQKFQQIDGTTKFEDLKITILHHKQIITHFEDFIKLYSRILVVQIYVFTLLICFLTLRLGTVSI